MAGSRAASYKDLNIDPGFFCNSTKRAARGRWFEGNRIRFLNGKPEKMGGWRYLSLTQGAVANAQYIGLARSSHDWSSLDDQKWIAVGTHVKLYLINSGRLYDITPIRKTSTLTNAITTTNLSATVTITDPDHRAEPGDYITIIGASAVGGITLSGSYPIIAVTGQNTYTITHSAPASSSTTGGGTFSIEYDIQAGLASNGELLGYGTGVYGAGTYGTPRLAGQGIAARLRIWSLDNWGEDLIASFNDGEIYHWDRTSGPNSRAKLISAAPKEVQRILVNPENRHLIAFGAQFASGEADPMRVRWCSQEDFDTWTPDADDPANTAGSKRLDTGSRIITAVKSRKQNYIWTDTQMYAMLFVGPNDVFGFDPLGTCNIAGPNAAIDADGVAYFMAIDNFYVYDGLLQVLPCEVWNRVFKTEATRIDRTQMEKIHASTYKARKEIRWEYPSEAGAGECDRYVIYNYEEKVWYDGAITRTAYHDISDASSPTGTTKNPYGFYGGYVYQHEFGLDEVEQSGTVAQSWYLRSGSITFGSDQFLFFHSIVPDYEELSGNVVVSLFTKSKPRQTLYRQKGPYTFPDTAVEYDIRARGSQVELQISGSALAQQFRMGLFQVLAHTEGSKGGTTVPAI